MIVLVMNSGSTSLRFSLIDVDRKLSLVSGGVERIGTNESYFKYQTYMGVNIRDRININSYEEAFLIIYKYLFDSNIGIIDSCKKINVIGHRIVHGGEKYTCPVIINDEVLNDIDQLSRLAPLHNKKALRIVKECINTFPTVSNIGVFDTSFHSTIPPENFLYAIPKELYSKYKIRKYGFHGISYSYVLNRYSKIVDMDVKNINTIACHLGGGSSICAIKNGKSYDTTMGYTPLSGLIMAKRSGSIDPALIPVISKIYNINSQQVIDILNNKSGYFAMTGDSDAKNIVERSLNGDKDAQFLRLMVNNDFKKNLLSMMSSFNRIDSIIITGGIGSKNKEQREMLLSNLELFGIKIDKKKNLQLFDEEGKISSKDSLIPVWVIPTNEELEIAMQCQKVLTR